MFTCLNTKLLHSQISACDEPTDHGNETSNKLEIFEVVWVDVGGGVDLETVVIFAGIFKQAVHGVQHLMGQQEEPLPEEDKTRDM